MPRRASGSAREFMLSVRLSRQELRQYASILARFLPINPGYACATPIDGKLFRELLNKLAPPNAEVPWKQWAEPTIKRQ